MYFSLLKDFVKIQRLKYTLCIFVYETNIFDLQFSEKHSWLVD